MNMSTLPISIRSLLIVAMFTCSVRAFAVGQTTTAPTPTPADGYRVAGTVLSKLDGHPLARTRVTLRDAKSPQKFETLITSDDGKFEFRGVPAGKYDLHGAKRGFISASYDQHEQFSTAIVTGAGLDTEALVLHLAPAAIIAGKVLDEAGEPVRHASVALYFRDHSSGVDQIRQFRGDQSDDQGAYELGPLMPGTYFMSVNATPWYAVHSNSTPANSGSEPQPPAANVDRSLDVAYPVTYYADATEPDSATPIPIRGGERLQVDIHLNPVPALHLLFHVPNSDNNQFVFPQLEQNTIGGSTYVQTQGAHPVSPGVVELTGVPAGRYNVHLNGRGAPTQMNGVDLTRDGDEIDTSSSQALGTLKITVQVPGATTVSAQLAIGLQPLRGTMFGPQQVNSKGEAEFQQLSAGRYEMVFWGGTARYSIAHMSAEGAEISGHAVTLAAGASASVSVRLVEGNVKIEGTAMRAGKPFAGAMIVLVPKNPDDNRDLFRRDQSDLDGTFALPNVIPGSYTILALENGWDLDWSQPAVIGAYAKGGRMIEVGNHSSRTMNLSEPVQVQSK
jgi:hypothetical protein